MIESIAGPGALFARATNPRQYDGPSLDWAPEGDANAPWPRYVRDRLAHEIGRIPGLAVIDIGAGIGHLALLFERLEALHAVALEPSAQHAGLARRRHPGLAVVRATLEEAPFRRAFDVAVAVLSFEHQASLDDAYAASAGLLAPGGALFVIAGDPEFHATPRWGLGLEVHERGDGSLLVATTYPVGTVHDIIRPPEHFERAARAAGFRDVARTALEPDDALMERDPRWLAFEGKPVAWLIAATDPR